MQFHSLLLQLITLLLLVSTSCSPKKEIPANSATTDQVSEQEYIQSIQRHQTQYMTDFVKDPRAPLNEKDLEDVHFFPANINFKCDCTFQTTPDSKPFEIATYSGKTKPFKKYGTATCPINGNVIEVHIYANLRTIAMPIFKDHLFIPFKDLTNGETTYGGGRYIDLKTSDIQNEKMTLDFNKAYNPWCAYSDGYNCPIPPVENHFDLSIKAGEMMWTGEKKKEK